MRKFSLLLALAGLGACQSETDAPTGEGPTPTPVAMTFDGADAADRAALIAHGERMSWMLGCKGCHGENLQGHNVTENEPDMGEWWAPNVTRKLADYSNKEFDRLVRHGEPRDGHEFWFMPSETFQYLSDADFAALVAYLRTVPAAGGATPPIKRGPMFEDMVAKGEFTNAKVTIARFAKEQPADLGPSHALGRYIAMTTCTECHNSKLQGYEGFSPDLLAMAGAYEPAELDHLLTTGEGKVKKDLGLMSETARHRFAKLTANERGALVAYVKALAARPQ